MPDSLTPLIIATLAAKDHFRLKIYLFTVKSDKIQFIIIKRYNLD